MSPPTSRSTPTRRKFAARDWLARCKAFLDLNLLHPGPKFLGPVIPISGDGRATLD